MKRSGLNTLNAAFFILVSAANIANCIIESKPLWEYFAYSLPLILAAVIIYIFKNKITPKITAGIFLAFSILSIVFGDHGNLTGSVFLCFALYVFANMRLSIVVGVMTVLVILGKSVIAHWTVPQVINYMSAYTYILAVYWILIHPKERTVECDSLDYVTMGVIKMVIAGTNRKEIADRLDITESGITKKLKSAREKMTARSTEELVLILAEKGHIGLK